MTLGWRVAYQGKTPPPGAVVRPDERLSWPRTVGLGAQHVVAMFGATFVFPMVMGLDPQPRDHDVRDRDDHLPAHRQRTGPQLPGHLSASFVGGVAAIRAQGGDYRARHRRDPGRRRRPGARRRAHPLRRRAGVIHRVLPPAVTGAVVMLIGFNLAPVVATIYWPQDQWVALLDHAVRHRRASLVLRGFCRPDRDLPRRWSSATSSPGLSTRPSARSPRSTPAPARQDALRVNFTRVDFADVDRLPDRRSARPHRMSPRRHFPSSRPSSCWRCPPSSR